MPTGSVLSDPVVPIYLGGICRSNCKLMRRWEWFLRALTRTQHTAEEIMQDGTYTGANKEFLIIKPNWMGFDEVFECYLRGCK